LRPRALLWTAIAAWTAGFSALSVLRHRAFNTGRFDLGNMVQAVWSTAHGHPLRVTGLDGEQISRLASHFDPILAAFAPLWWIWPSPDALLVAQAAAIALGALPVFWLARKHLGTDRAGLGFALAYLLYPPVQWLALNEFHAVALACPLLLAAFWYLDEGRPWPFALLALAACATKEEVGLVVAGLGVWYALSRRRWRAGAAVVMAQRTSREGETLVKRIVSALGYRLINRISDVDIPADTGDFRLMDRRVVGHLLRFTETHGFLRGLVALVGFEQAIVEFERPPRYSGKGNYNRFVGSLKIGLNGVIGFSTALLSLSTLIGFIAAIGGFLIAVAYAIAQIVGNTFPVGNPTIVVLILLMGGLQLICFGIMGQYVGRIYEEVKRRPRFVVDRAAGFDLVDGLPIRALEPERPSVRYD